MAKNIKYSAPSILDIFAPNVELHLQIKYLVFLSAKN